MPPTNKLLYNIQERLTLAGQPYLLLVPPSANTCEILVYIETNTIPRTVHSIP